LPGYLATRELQVRREDVSHRPKCIAVDLIALTTVEFRSKPAGVLVEIQGTTPASGVAGDMTTGGGFKRALLPGKYTIRCTCPGHAERVFDMVVTPKPTPTELTEPVELVPVASTSSPPSR
jgi:hypothetical protein